jgi:hypothetical protein
MRFLILWIFRKNEKIYKIQKTLIITFSKNLVLI